MNTRISSILAVPAVFAFWAMSCSHAGTFYLSPNGNDVTGDGSPGRPWRSIRHATDRVPDDGSTIVLRDGLYVGSQSVTRRFEQVCTIRAENPYRARLQSPRDSARVLSCYGGRNVVLRGLEMFGSGGTGGEYMIHLSKPETQRIALIDCIVHDCYANDMIKINDGAKTIVFRGCLFYNPEDRGGREHFDINTTTDVIVEDSILLNDYEASGRPVGNKSHSFVVIKNSGSTPNVTKRITFRRNIFLNYQGKVDQCYLLLGEDGKPFYEAQQVLIENNLFLHHSPVRFWGTLLLKGGLQDIIFRANTIVGHPHIRGSGAYAMMCLRIGENPPMGNLTFANNIYSDATGQMPRFSLGKAETFDPQSQQVLHNNIYFNGGRPIPNEPHDVLVPDRDSKKHFGDPKLGDPNQDLILPRWSAEKGQFLSGERTISGEFARIVQLYAAPGNGSVAIDAADPKHMPTTDILKRQRGPRPDIGCFEMQPATAR